ncbi:MAG: type III secretion system export apparatus subunit SctT, partial [Methylococcales bacterium]|nr:type III secretion system export apparatus subunit SctT [Methylococcales bacterium]
AGRNGIAISLSFIVVPIVFHQIQGIPLGGMQHLMLVFKEVTIGLFMGYLASIVFWAVATAGSIIDMQRGAMSAQMFNPIISGTSSPLGLFFTQTAVTLFMTSGGFLALLSAIYQSYIRWPVSTFYPNFELNSISLFLGQYDKLLYLALQVAAPAMILMFLTDLGVGFIGRFVPSINVFLLAMPIKSMLAFLVVALYMSTTLYFLSSHFVSYSYIQTMLENIFL